jgi:hypothetical protein
VLKCYCQGFLRDRKDGVKHKVGIIDCSVWEEVGELGGKGERAEEVKEKKGRGRGSKEKRKKWGEII